MWRELMRWLRLRMLIDGVMERKDEKKRGEKLRTSLGFEEICY